MPKEGPELTHSCLETLDQIYACIPDLTDQAIENLKNNALLMAVTSLEMEIVGQEMLF